MYFLFLFLYKLLFQLWIHFNPEAEEFLNSLGNDNLGVVSIVGKYRTGKSFFVNRVLLDKCNEGFAVGPTIQPCTKVSLTKLINHY